jgi:hypothetical protein
MGRNGGFVRLNEINAAIMTQSDELAAVTVPPSNTAGGKSMRSFPSRQLKRPLQKIQSFILKFDFATNG